LHPVRLTGAAQASKAKKRLEKRIRISGSMIQAGVDAKSTLTKRCVGAHSGGSKCVGL
jgi:hypothetical protein